ncbi:MAG: PEP-CTERM sorting domain-containing protein [Planctomycetales bacterium]|nr:PEP-CTERM sorting domain-containing protein [Planctomycetales bacterium]
MRSTSKSVIAESFIFGLVVFAFPLRLHAQSLEVVPQEWDFGDVQVGDFMEATIRGNSAAPFSPLVVQDVYPETTGTDFSIEGFTISPGSNLPGVEMPPFVIPPGEYFDVIVRFTPLSLGQQSVDLIFVTNDHKEPFIPAALTGRGVPIPEPSALVLLLLGSGIAVAWRRS